MTELKGMLDAVTHKYLRELCEAQMDPMTEAICKEQAEDTSLLIVNTLMFLHLFDNGQLNEYRDKSYFLGYPVIVEDYANELWRIES